MKVVIAGEIPFLEEVGQLCVTAGHDTAMYLVEDFLSAQDSGYLLENLGEVAVAIELHNESAGTKHALLLALSGALNPEALILTSSLNASATQAASWVNNPSRVVGFGIVPPLGKQGITGDLVELARAMQTEDSYLQQAQAFWQGLGLETAVVADGPGLVRARTICCIINEAASALMEGVASASDIDKAMQLGTNYPFGPLAWADQIGLDTVLGVMTGLFEEWGEDRYRPSPMLKRLVMAGKLGQKTGAGFYHYESPSS